MVHVILRYSLYSVGSINAVLSKFKVGGTRTKAGSTMKVANIKKVLRSGHFCDGARKMNRISPRRGNK